MIKKVLNSNSVKQQQTNTSANVLSNNKPKNPIKQNLINKFKEEEKIKKQSANENTTNNTNNLNQANQKIQTNKELTSNQIIKNFKTSLKPSVDASNNKFRNTVIDKSKNEKTKIVFENERKSLPLNPKTSIDNNRNSSQPKSLNLDNNLSNLENMRNINRTTELNKMKKKINNKSKSLHYNNENSKAKKDTSITKISNNIKKSMSPKNNQNINTNNNKKKNKTPSTYNNSGYKSSIKKSWSMNEANLEEDININSMKKQINKQKVRNKIFYI